MTFKRELRLSAPTGAPDMTNGSIFFIGTATVLIRYAGFTILTDPNFIHRHEKVGLGYGLHATRLTDPALDIGMLPPLDLVVLSHFHGDHFDQVAERDLNKTLPIVTTPEAARELGKRGFRRCEALHTWEPLSCAKNDLRLEITATPGRHGPGVVARILPEVMGSILDFQAGGRRLMRIYITGDTLVFDEILEIPKRYPDIDLALLHLGGTRVLGILVTMDGRQGVRMLKIINPRKAIPIHCNDYTVFKSPLEDFQREVRAAGLEDRLHYLSHGETYNFSIAEEGRMAA